MRMIRIYPPIVQYLLVLFLLCAATAVWAEPVSAKYKLDLTAEGRYFPQSPADVRQADQSLSFAVQGRADYEWNGGDTQLALVPFARYDSEDNERSHADLRELEVRHRMGDFEGRLGIGKVFWGTTESQHLVDIINQTDAVEDIDYEEKLGQPLAALSWASPVGTFSGFLLPYFRERTLPGVKGRFRAPLPYDTDNALYESGHRNHHVDYALRWKYSGSGLDVGLSQFWGTAREPRFILNSSLPEPLLVPVYDLISQTGVDFNYVQGGWIWKLEALCQTNRVRDFGAAVGGFEYTIPQAGGEAPEIGLLAEYNWDSRGGESTSMYQNDIFLGIRLTMSDFAGTELLAGIMQDLQYDSRYFRLEASRRIAELGRIGLKVHIFNSVSHDDSLIVLERDSCVQLEYTFNF